MPVLVVVAVNDLMLAPRLLEGARRLGYEVRRAGNPDAVVEAARSAERAVVVVDLHDERLAPAALFPRLRDLPGVRSVGYFGHLDPLRAAAARESGCTRTLTRGQLVGDLDGALRAALDA